MRFAALVLLLAPLTQPVFGRSAYAGFGKQAFDDFEADVAALTERL